ncbi:hypothetical protein PHEL85_0644 [Polaribacter sp. Hel1_85]|nr:hypothetical protein PHEL85_0644 [Polaribacter sp. Hel1_85]
MTNTILKKNEIFFTDAKLQILQMFLPFLFVINFRVSTFAQT